MIRSPVRPPARPRRDHRRVETLERAGDVDALAAGRRQAGARPVTVPELEVRHRERAIDCGVEGDGDDHEKKPRADGARSASRTTVAVRRARAARPCGGEQRPRAEQRAARTRSRSGRAARPRVTGRATAVGATIRSTSGRPTRTARTSGFRGDERHRAAAVAAPPPRRTAARRRASACGTAKRPRRAAAAGRVPLRRASGCRGSPRRS